MQLCAMNMNLMAEKNFVVVESKETVLGAIVVHEKAFFYLYAICLKRTML